MVGRGDPAGHQFATFSIRGTAPAKVGDGARSTCSSATAPAKSITYRVGLDIIATRPADRGARSLGKAGLMVAAVAAVLGLGGALPRALPLAAPAARDGLAAERVLASRTVLLFRQFVDDDLGCASISSATARRAPRWSSTRPSRSSTTSRPQAEAGAHRAGPRDPHPRRSRLRARPIRPRARAAGRDPPTRGARVPLRRAGGRRRGRGRARPHPRSAHSRPPARALLVHRGRRSRSPATRSSSAMQPAPTSPSRRARAPRTSSIRSAGSSASATACRCTRRCRRLAVRRGHDRPTSSTIAQERETDDALRFHDVQEFVLVSASVSTPGRRRPSGSSA